MTTKPSGLALIAILEKCKTADEMIAKVKELGIDKDTPVSEEWLDFWHEYMTFFYGWNGKGSKYKPVEPVRRIMVKYEIKEIKPPNNEELESTKTESSQP